MERVFLTSADGLQKVEHENAAIDAATAAGVPLIVKLSSIRAEVGSLLPPFDWHGRIEEHLQRSVVPAVILRSGFYMSNLIASAEAIRHWQAVRASRRSRDPDDRPSGRRSDRRGSAGHQWTGGPDVRAHRSRGDHVRRDRRRAFRGDRPVEFVDVPDEAARQGLVEAGMPDWLVEHLIALFGTSDRARLSRPLTPHAP
jgi:uncharacterized protein YbjT (DUF2867 family)